MEDIICVLRSQQTPPEVFESQYGCVAPSSALKALQRDSFITGTKQRKPSVYQKPMAEVRTVHLTKTLKHSEDFFMYIKAKKNQKGIRPKLVI